MGCCGLAMAPPTFNISPPSLLSTEWIDSPRSHDSSSRPRRSLLSSHFSQKEGEEVGSGRKVPGSNGGRAQPSTSELSRSLPSPPISAFLDQEEEAALEPRTPPDVTTFHPPLTPMAPRKSYKCRVAPRGKQQPRRLNFGGGEPAESHTLGDLHPQTPKDQSLNSFAPVSIPKPSQKLFGSSSTIHARELR